MVHGQRTVSAHSVAALRSRFLALPTPTPLPTALPAPAAPRGPRRQDCVNVSVVGVRLADSGFWTQTFRRCDKGKG